MTLSEIKAMLKEDILEILHQMDKKIDSLGQKITGNGGMGLEQRIEAIERWKAAHPRECPHALNGKQIVARRMLEIATMSLIVTGLTFLAKALKWF